MEKEYIRLIEQILKIETTLTPLLKIPKSESLEHRVLLLNRTEYYYLPGFMELHCIKQELLCQHSEKNFGCGMAN